MTLLEKALDKTLRVGIVGMGLIGGSIAKRIRLVFPDTCIVGVAHRAETSQAALADGTLSVAGESLALLSGCDLVFVATPIERIVDTVRSLQEMLPADAMITDVASVKQDIVQALCPQASGKAFFLGGHPMAGKEQTGYGASDAVLLSGATYVLMPSDHPFQRALWVFLEALGCRVLEMAPQVHDRAVALASHGPYLMACLTTQALMCASDSVSGHQLISSGFRDTTRVAASSPAWGAAVCCDNAEAIGQFLAQVKADLAILESEIQNREYEALMKRFSAISEHRQTLFRP